METHSHLNGDTPFKWRHTAIFKCNEMRQHDQQKLLSKDNVTNN